MSTRSTFSPGLLLGFLAAAAGTIVLTLYFMSRDHEAIDALGPSTYSRSAIGYAGIFEVLQKLGVPVIRGKHASASKAAGGVLVIAEPYQWHTANEAVASLLKAEKILVVLPKWVALPSKRRPGWAGHVVEKMVGEAQLVLNRVTDKATVVREPAMPNWTVNSLFRYTPQIDGMVQLIKSDKLRPLVASDKGMLLGELTKGKQTIWILSDPDVIANHALGKPSSANTALIVKAIGLLRTGTGPVVFDETIHEFASRPTAPWKLLFQYPFFIVTLLGLGATGLLLWATMGRFGVPEEAPAALTAGKQGLVENVARLMDFAGHQKLMVVRYVEATIRDTARQAHAPKGLSLPETVAWMQRVGKARDVTTDCETILHRTNTLIAERSSNLSAFVDAARAIYLWKKEILDGPSSHSRHH